MSQIIPTCTKELSEFEFDALCSAGSKLIENLIFNRVRVHDNQLDTESCIQWLAINTTDYYYVRRGYCCIAVYFVSSADKHLLEKYIA